MVIVLQEVRAFDVVIRRAELSVRRVHRWWLPSFAARRRLVISVGERHGRCSSELGAVL